MTVDMAQWLDALGACRCGRTSILRGTRNEFLQPLLRAVCRGAYQKGCAARGWSRRAWSAREPVPMRDCDERLVISVSFDLDLQRCDNCATHL
jgi:hypothetical protein